MNGVVGRSGRCGDAAIRLAVRRHIVCNWGLTGDDDIKSLVGHRSGREDEARNEYSNMKGKDGSDRAESYQYCKPNKHVIPL